MKSRSAEVRDRLAEILSAPTDPEITFNWLEVAGVRLSAMSRASGGLGTTQVYGSFPDTWEVAMSPFVVVPYRWTQLRLPMLTFRDEEGEKLVIYRHVPVDWLIEFVESLIFDADMLAAQVAEPTYSVSGSDVVTHPSHYVGPVPGIECIEVTQHFNFNRGNVIKYVWRAGAKGDEIEDLRKARQYLDFEIDRLTKGRSES